MKTIKKSRTETIYGTTKDIVDFLEVEIAPDGSGIRFAQEMVDTYVEKTLLREQKDPKCVTRIPTSGPEHTFLPDRAMKSFDRIFAVDTGHRRIQGEEVSVTGVVEGQWNYIGSPRGLDKRIRLKPVCCFGFQGVEEIVREKVGWVVALAELQKSGPFKKTEKVALIVDSDLSHHSDYNSRRSPLVPGIYLPDNVTLVYASADKRDDVTNYLIRWADSMNQQALKQLNNQTLPWDTSYRPHGLWQAIMNIPFKVTYEQPRST